ncbi:MAG: hypothetical protein M3134_01270 [Actinomycetota bacterium]|nr:hypothetical protein [Actinomycetota bacterium]
MHAGALDRFARNDLPRLLDRLLASPSALQQVAHRSYIHDNGFVKIVLVPGRPQRPALRLHIWPAEEPADGNVHNHCWDFTSFVLAGHLVFDEYVVSGDGTVPALHYAYEPASDFEYELRLLGPVRLRQTSSGAHPCGAVYEMSPETLHRTAAGDAYTATLLVQGQRRREHADVYVTRPSGVPTRFHNAPLGAGDLRRHLETLMPAAWP